MELKHTRIPDVLRVITSKMSGSTANRTCCSVCSVAALNTSECATEGLREVAEISLSRPHSERKLTLSSLAIQFERKEVPCVCRLSPIISILLKPQHQHHRVNASQCQGTRCSLGQGNQAQASPCEPRIKQMIAMMNLPCNIAEKVGSLKGWIFMVRLPSASILTVMRPNSS